MPFLTNCNTQTVIITGNQNKMFWSDENEQMTASYLHVCALTRRGCGWHRVAHIWQRYTSTWKRQIYHHTEWLNYAKRKWNLDFFSRVKLNFFWKLIGAPQLVFAKVREDVHVIQVTVDRVQVLHNRKSHITVINGQHMKENPNPTRKQKENSEVKSLHKYFLQFPTMYTTCLSQGFKMCRLFTVKKER